MILQVLCLDECTANVDNQTAFLLQNTISAECKGMTVLTIAHRISTVMKMNNILVLDQGKLVSCATRINILKYHCKNQRGIWEWTQNICTTITFRKNDTIITIQMRMPHLLKIAVKNTTYKKRVLNQVTTKMDQRFNSYGKWQTSRSWVCFCSNALLSN